MKGGVRGVSYYKENEKIHAFGWWCSNEDLHVLSQEHLV